MLLQRIAANEQRLCLSSMLEFSEKRRLLTENNQLKGILKLYQI